MVIVAPARGARPGASPARERPPQPEHDPNCPFCPGNEEDTPPEILRVPAGAEAWRVRVIPNKYPALVSGADAGRTSTDDDERLAAVGPHEVIIESERHNRRFQELTDPELLDVLRAYRSRFAAATAQRSVRHVMLFRNQGPMANATLAHPHAQLVGLPVVPPLVEDALRRSRAFRAETGRSLLAALAEEERRVGARVVLEGERFLVFVPEAASFDLEMWIVAKESPPRFDRAGDELLAELGRTVRACVAALEAAADGPDYNLILQAPPLLPGADEALPWYVQVIPRTAGMAGFEIGAGIRILTVTPETAAGRLRRALAEVARP